MIDPVEWLAHVERVIDWVLAAGQHPSISRDDLRSEGYLTLCELSQREIKPDDVERYVLSALRKRMLSLLYREKNFREHHSQIDRDEDRRRTHRRDGHVP